METEQKEVVYARVGDKGYMVGRDLSSIIEGAHKILPELKEIEIRRVERENLPEEYRESARYVEESYDIGMIKGYLLMNKNNGNESKNKPKKFKRSHKDTLNILEHEYGFSKEVLEKIPKKILGLIKLSLDDIVSTCDEIPEETDKILRNVISSIKKAVQDYNHLLPHNMVPGDYFVSSLNNNSTRFQRLSDQKIYDNLRGLAFEIESVFDKVEHNNYIGEIFDVFGFSVIPREETNDPSLPKTKGRFGSDYLPPEEADERLAYKVLGSEVFI